MRSTTGTSLQSAPGHEEGLQLRIASYNILVDFNGSSWEQRGPTVAKILLALDVDLIGIQEASELQLAHLQQNLPEFDCFVGDRSDGHLGDQRWYEFVPIFYRRDRFELMDKSSHWLSENPSRPGSTFADSKFHGRCLTWVKLKDIQTSRVFVMANTHTHGKQADKAVGLIHATVARVSGELPVVLTGDFNFVPDSMPYELMVSSGEGTTLALNDAHSLATSRAGPMATHAGGRRIDYIFLRGKSSVRSYRVLNTKMSDGADPSDHRPVTVDVTWR